MLSYCPTLFKPKILSLKNRWTRNLGLRSQTGRDLVIIIISAIIISGIYKSAYNSISLINRHPEVQFISLEAAMGIVLSLLFAILVFSSCISALCTLYLSEDLDLIVSSPISKQKFFSGKLFEILISSSWMIVVFGMPILVAMERYYQIGVLFYLYTFAVIVPFLLIPSLIAILAIAFLSSLVPANKTQALIPFFFIFAIAAVILIAGSSTNHNISYSASDILETINSFSVLNQWWLPSYWLAVCIAAVITVPNSYFFCYFAALFVSAFILLLSSYSLVSRNYFETYSQSRNFNTSTKLHSRRSQRLLNKLFPFLKQQYRAIFTKEFKIFARDMSQTFQLIMLMAICLVYLYNFRIINIVNETSESSRALWSGILTISNIAMGAFVITALSTRFVFPSISLEGRAFWLMQSSPLSLRQILKAKFWSWLLPVTLISSVILGAGALAINAEPYLILLTIVCSWIVSYGIVGMGIGLGALFANFDWENPSQLCASFGSIIYMFFSTVLIGLNLIPIAILILMKNAQINYRLMSSFEWYLCVACCCFLIIYLNHTVANHAIKIGERALLKNGN